ncbi:hypothetical protein [Maricaulis sp.]|uniref:hypothetical protein n=1 Tax=Maricaulis sp. TaxID=1486257 RepID=UPI0025BA4CBF|nr:hypothetical protein [Maricaulis sp.]
MVEFIIAIIEWFAVVALSSMGIETLEAGNCAADSTGRPAEYREAALLVSDADAKLGWARIRSDGCNQWMPVRDAQEMPELLSPPLVYNS